jgi:hypothetical protein
VNNTNLNAVPLTSLTSLQGVIVDISSLVRFHFWHPAYFKLSESSFPSESTEALGHVVGILEHCGHALTYKVLLSESDAIIYCRAIPDDDNVLACISGGESPTHSGSLKDRSNMDKSKLTSTPMMRLMQNHHLLPSSILKT